MMDLGIQSLRDSYGTIVRTRDLPRHMLSTKN
jgi:hypothetical protein